jgi:DNA-directed RNA polymerase alpha subunit
MNGTIHIIGADRSEEWIDGENVKIVYRAGMDRDTWGHGAKIVFKDGEEMEFRNAIHVEVIPAPTETAQVTCDSDPLSLIRQFEEDNPPTDNEDEAVLIPDWYNDSVFYPMFDKKIVDLNLCNRTKIILDRNEVYTVRDLCQYAKTDILKFRNAGKKTLTELDDFLEEHGLGFSIDVEKIEKYHQEIMKRNNPK